MAGRPKGLPKTGGRKKGTPNKNTALLKDAILEAATLAGDKDGLVGYLKTQAKDNPGPFMALLGKVLPLQIAGDEENPLVTITKIELIAGDGNSSN
jgi:hypothetical protein